MLLQYIIFFSIWTKDGVLFRSRKWFSVLIVLGKRHSGPQKCRFLMQVSTKMFTCCDKGPEDVEVPPNADGGGEEIALDSFLKLNIEAKMDPGRGRESLVRRGVRISNRL